MKKILGFIINFWFFISFLIIPFLIYYRTNAFTNYLLFYSLLLGSFSSLSISIMLYKKIKKILFLIIALLSFIIILGFSFQLSLNIHKYFTPIIFNLFIYYSLIIALRNELFKNFKKEKLIKKIVFNFLYLLMFILFLWILILICFFIIMKSYYIELIIYSVYNLILCFIIFFTALYYYLNFDFLKIIISKNNMFINGYDITEEFDKKKISILKLFCKTSKNHLHCYDIFLYLKNNNLLDKDYYLKNINCEKCLKDDETASDCKAYTNLIYPAILLIKNVLEKKYKAAEIIYPKDKHKIKTHGWILKFKDDIEIEIL